MAEKDMKKPIADIWALRAMVALGFLFPLIGIVVNGWSWTYLAWLSIGTVLIGLYALLHDMPDRG